MKGRGEGGGRDGFVRRALDDLWGPTIEGVESQRDGAARQQCRQVALPALVQAALEVEWVGQVASPHSTNSK